MPSLGFLTGCFATDTRAGNRNAKLGRISEREVMKGLVTTAIGKKPLDFPDTAIYPLYAIVQTHLTYMIVDEQDFIDSFSLPMLSLDCGHCGL